MQDYFYNIDTTSIKNSVIIIDIDGTLVADGKDIVEKKSKDVINMLSKDNNLLLCSNKKLPNRNEAISKQLNVPLLDTPFKKPNKKIIDSINLHYSKNLVIIGDKYITDGIFAKRVGATFFKIKRIESRKESLKIRIIYWLDDLIYFIVGFLK